MLQNKGNKKMENEKMFHTIPEDQSNNETNQACPAEEINESNQELLCKQLGIFDSLIQISDSTINNLNTKSGQTLENFNEGVSRVIDFSNNQELKIQQTKAIVGKSYEYFADDLKKSQERFNESSGLFNKWLNQINMKSSQATDEFDQIKISVDPAEINHDEMDINLENNVNEVNNVLAHLSNLKLPKISYLKHDIKDMLNKIYNLDVNDYRKTNGMSDIEELNYTQKKLMTRLDEFLIILNEQIIGEIGNTKLLMTDTRAKFGINDKEKDLDNENIPNNNLASLFK